VRLRSAPSSRRTPQSPASSTASSSLGDEEFETLDVDILSTTMESLPPPVIPLLSRTVSDVTTMTTRATSAVSWRSRSSYTK